MGTPKGQEPQWIACVFLEVTFFVNAAGLFFLSALIEKNQNAKVSTHSDDYLQKKYGDKKELTTVKMPPALVEGTESYVMFGLMILLGHDSWWQGTLYWILSAGVIITILQRLHWAYYNLD